MYRLMRSMLIVLRESVQLLCCKLTHAIVFELRKDLLNNELGYTKYLFVRYRLAGSMLISLPESLAVL